MEDRKEVIVYIDFSDHRRGLSKWHPSVMRRLVVSLFATSGRVNNMYLSITFTKRTLTQRARQLCSIVFPNVRQSCPHYNTI